MPNIFAARVNVCLTFIIDSLSQLSVPQYFAEYTVRGANLDTLWLPLTNAPYLLDRLDVAASEPTDLGQRDIVASLTQWTDPGIGGFYDDLGDPEQSPHLVTPLPWDSDPDVGSLSLSVSVYVSAFLSMSLSLPLSLLVSLSLSMSLSLPLSLPLSVRCSLSLCVSFSPFSSCDSHQQWH